MSELNYEVIPGAPERVTVFLHGLMGRGRNFLQHAKALQEVTTSVLVDQPNHGDSAWTRDFGYPEMADAVARLLAELPLTQGRKIHLVGHSMGGKTAMLVALRHPQLLASLTVVDIAPRASRSTAPFNHLLGSLLELNLETLPDRKTANTQLREAIPDATLRAFLLANVVRDPASGRCKWAANVPLLHRALPVMVGFPETPGATYDGPVLWLAGGDSNYIKNTDLPRMTALFPDVVPVKIPGAGHWVHADQPAEFDRLLREFITQES